MRLFLLFTVFLLLPFTINAQFSGSLDFSSATLSAFPAHPGPFENVTIAIENDHSFGAGVSIAWYLNGNKIPDTDNLRSIATQVGKVSSNNIIEAVIESPQSGVFRLKKTITPFYLDVVIEPQTHIPDFYLGRALPSIGSQINATALLFGASTPAAQLLYTWEINGQTFGGGSVRGQNNITFNSPLGSNVTLAVTVADSTGVSIARQNFTIPNVKPTVHFYEVNTLYGVNPKPLKTFNLIANSATISAEPYFLDSRIYNNPDVSLWNVGGVETRNTSRPYEITFERTDYNGSARLGFEVRSTVSLLQNASSELTVNY